MINKNDNLAVYLTSIAIRCNAITYKTSIIMIRLN